MVFVCLQMTVWIVSIMREDLIFLNSPIQPVEPLNVLQCFPFRNKTDCLLGTLLQWTLENFLYYLNYKLCLYYNLDEFVGCLTDSVFKTILHCIFEKEKKSTLSVKSKPLC